MTSLAESLLFANLKIIPKYILTNPEIVKIRNCLTKQGIQIKSDHEVYELLSLHTSTNNNTLTFEIKIPILSITNYKLYRIIAIPFNGTQIVNLPNYILRNNEELNIVQGPCIKVNSEFVCRCPTTAGNQPCLHNLLNNKPATCDTVETSRNQQIYSPIEGILIIMKPQGTSKSTVQ